MKECDKGFKLGLNKLYHRIFSMVANPRVDEEKFNRIRDSIISEFVQELSAQQKSIEDLCSYVQYIKSSRNAISNIEVDTLLSIASKIQNLIEKRKKEDERKFKERDKFKIAFGKLYDDVLYAWRDEGNIYHNWFRAKTGEMIDKFISETDELYSDIDDLESFLSYINGIYPLLRQDDCIHEHTMRTNFLKDVMNKIIGLIKNRKESLEKDKKEVEELSKQKMLQQFKQFMEYRLGDSAQDCLHDMLLFGTGYLRVSKSKQESVVKIPECNAIRITTLRDNPNFNEYSREDISVGSILKGLSPVAPKPEDTYKPGDRVFFVKENIHGDDSRPFRMNLYLGIVKDWAVGSQGKVHCTFDASFNVMDLESLDLDVGDSEDVKTLIESEDFSKALIASNTKSVYGDIVLCVVDEKHFPKLNSIVAKIAKPEKPKPFNPMAGQVFKAGMGWMPE